MERPEAPSPPESSLVEYDPEDLRGPEDDLFDDLPAVPEWAAENWRKIGKTGPGTGRKTGPETRTRAALRWFMAGDSAPEAARKTGVDGSGGSGIMRWARFYGLAKGRECTPAHILRAHEITALSQAEILRRLSDPNRRRLMELKELNFIAGTMLDKISTNERWSKDKPESGDYVSALERAMGKLEPGEEVSATITLRRDRIRPPPPSDRERDESPEREPKGGEVIDVTPEGPCPEWLRTEGDAR